MNILRTAAFVFLGMVIGSEAYSAESLRSSSVDRRQNRCYAVRVEAIGTTSSSETRPRRRFRRRFSASEILDLRFNIMLHAKNQSGLVEIELYTPDGDLYQTLRAELDAEDPSGGRARYRGRRARVVTARLPVAGSHITSRSLYGKWRTELHLDGNEKRCKRPGTFVVQP